MSHDSVRATIALIHGQIEKLQTEINAHKKTINSLSRMVGDSEPYADTDEVASTGAMVQRNDEFYGKKLATIVRTILERRHRANLGAIAVPDLYKVLKEGGYQFEAKNDANSQRGLHIALSKNSVFHRLPNGNYGLREWYPAIKDRAKPAASNGDAVDESADETPLHEELQDNGDGVPAGHVTEERAEEIAAETVGKTRPKAK